MSTTLIPPTLYVVKPRGRASRMYATVADAAGAIVVLGSSPAAVGAVTGRRARGLTDGERHELERRVGACRLSSGRGWATKWGSMANGAELGERV